MNSFLHNRHSKATLRVGFVDVARGIAIWGIVLGHQGIPSINRVVFAFHVPVFFLLAGCFFNEGASWGQYLKKKGISLLRPYLLSSVALLFFGVVFHILQFGAYGLPSELARRLAAPAFGMGVQVPFPFGISVPGLGRHMPAIGAIWFLVALFWSLLLMRCACRVRNVWQPIIVIGLFFLGCCSTNVIWLPWSLQPGLCALLFVHVGYLAKPLLDVQKMTLETRGMLFLLGLSLWWCFIQDFHGFYLVECNFGHGFADIACSLAACWCVVEASRFIDARLPQIASILRFFGRHSLIVLCVHVVELHSWGSVWGKIGHELSALGLSDVRFVMIGVKILAIACTTACFVRMETYRCNMLHRKTHG